MKTIVSTWLIVIFPLVAPAQKPSENCSEVLVISKIITPDKDGSDDFFTVRAAGGQTFRFPVELKVFNRWGTIVYESKNYGNNWNAPKLPDGTYVYSIVYGSCTINGSVDVMRQY